MFTLEPFAIFRNNTIGQFFRPDGVGFRDNESLIPSIIHGRSIAFFVNKYEWILIKGGGWNYGGPIVYRSKKDDELIFGLYPSSAAIREIEISREIEKISNDFPKVLYYKKISDYNLTEELNFLKDIRFSNGKLVDPCLLYTKVNCPIRVADIPYLDKKELNDAIDFCCEKWNINADKYIENFAHHLGKNIAILHKNNFNDDTLEYSNVTMLAEIVDYELVSHPDVKFNGEFEEEWLIEERKEKEILYAAEIVMQLSNLLHRKMVLSVAYKMIVNSYEKIYPEFIKNIDSIIKILNGEKYII